MDLNNLILFFLLTLFSLFFYKFFLIYLEKKFPNFLTDNQLLKPQAFHQVPTSTSGGAYIFFSFLIIYFNFLLFKETLFFEYFSFCTLFFILGFVDDIKIEIKPSTRLILMIVFLILLINFNDFYIHKTGIGFLNNWIGDSEIFSLFFVCLCFLFIVNGANLIDGYNGLLGIHSLIILVNLLIINYLNGNVDLVSFLFFGILVLAIFLLFNFPKARVFLGDSGSYFLGAFVAISVIKTSIANPIISPFFFCIMLFYLFFEVFFSFFRKLVKEKKSPIHPDKKHLHMLLYKLLLKKSGDKLKSNYLVSLIINFTYLILISPTFFMMNDGMFCKYYSVVLFIFYIFCYKIAYEKDR